MALRRSPRPEVAARQLLADPRVGHVLDGLAEQGVKLVQAAVPDDTGATDRGTTAGRGFENGKRVAYIETNGEAWNIIQEYGSAKQPPRRAISGAIAKLGLRRRLR